MNLAQNVIEEYKKYTEARVDNLKVQQLREFLNN